MMIMIIIASDQPVQGALSLNVMSIYRWKQLSGKSLMLDAHLSHTVSCRLLCSLNSIHSRIRQSNYTCWPRAMAPAGHIECCKRTGDKEMSEVCIDTVLYSRTREERWVIKLPATRSLYRGHRLITYTPCHLPCFDNWLRWLFIH